MADNFYSSYLPNSSGSSGVTSLNSLSGALTLVAGSNITITPSGSNITISSTGSGGITSINSDLTAAQTLSVGTAGTDFAIVDAGSGSHVFNLPTASASNRGALSSADWTTFNNKQPAGSYATTTLNNLGSTAINADLIAGVSNSINLGSDTISFKNLHIYKIYNQANEIISVDQQILIDDSARNSVNWKSRRLLDSASSNTSVDWDARTLLNHSAATIADWSGLSMLLPEGADFNSNKGTNLLDPTNPQDAATKNYVDSAIAGSGTVTSVALADSTGIFNISGSPVTTSGTLTLASLQSQSAKTFLAAPNGNSGAPSFRLILASDIPTLNQNTTGSAGSVSGTNVITNSNLAQMPANTLKGNNTGITANAADLTVSQVNSMLGDILADGSVPFTADQSMGSNKLTSVNNPTNPQDAATKSYVDNLVQGLSWKQTVVSATTTALPGTYTYNNGTAGVGATITQNGTISGNALNPQDGVTLSANDRFLVKDETGGNDPYNGIYVVTQVGDGVSVPYILTRSTDADTAAKLQFATTEVGPGASTQPGFIYREANLISTVGTDPVSFALISSGLNWVFGNGLTTSGNTVSVLANPTNPSIVSAAPGLSVNLNAAGAIVSSSTGLEVNLESSNPTLKISSNQLGAKLDASRAITTGASGIGVNVDGSSVSISSNQVTALKPVSFAYTLTSTDITNQYVDLDAGNGFPSSNPAYGTSASVNSVSVSPDGGPIQQKTVDFTVSLTGGSGGSTRVTFAGDLATGGAAALIAGDVVTFAYSYL